MNISDLKLALGQINLFIYVDFNSICGSSLKAEIPFLLQIPSFELKKAVIRFLSFWLTEKWCDTVW